MNRILRISTDRWVTGRAIRWACEDARETELVDAGPMDMEYTRVGTDATTDTVYWDGRPIPVDWRTAITITVERDNER
jgi:hypothetical protein